MLSELKTNAAQVVASTKTAFWVTISAYISEWYVDWGSPLISALTSIAGLIMIIILIRYHLINTKKIQLELKKQEEQNKL